MNLTASPQAIQPASQPEIRSLSGAPLVQSHANGDEVFVAYGTGPHTARRPGSPNQFSTLTANDSTNDLSAASDDTMFVVQKNGTTENRAAALARASVPATPALLRIPGRNQVPGVKGGIDILDSHNAALRVRILLPQKFMTAVDGLHGSFFCHRRQWRAPLRHHVERWLGA